MESHTHRPVRLAEEADETAFRGPDLLTAEEAAVYLRVAPKWIYGAQHLQHRLPLVQQHRRRNRAQRRVGIAAERRRLGRDIKAHDTADMTAAIPFSRSPAICLRDQPSYFGGRAL